MGVRSGAPRLTDSPIYWRQRREQAIEMLCQAVRELEGVSSAQALEDEVRRALGVARLRAAKTVPTEVGS